MTVAPGELIFKPRRDNQFCFQAVSRVSGPHRQIFAAEQELSLSIVEMECFNGAENGSQKQIG